MRAFLLTLGAVAVAACGPRGPGNTTATHSQPIIRGDGCAFHDDQASCEADTQDQCKWVNYPPPTAIGAPCQILPDGGTNCPKPPPPPDAGSGVCVGPIGGGCGPVPLPGSGGGGVSADGGSTTGGGVSADGGSPPPLPPQAPPPPPNPCSQFTDKTSCNADTSDDCYWIYAAACPQYILPDGGTGGCTANGFCAQQLPIPPGGCDAGSTGGGGGGISAGCACAAPAQPAGGTGPVGTYVCVEQIGGPATSTPPAITCQELSSNCSSTDPCLCVTGQGTCRDAPNVSGLCICDDGIR